MIDNADLILQNFKKVSPRSSDIAERFYSALFKRAPALLPLFDHTDWAKPYAAGFYAKKYLGVLLTREQTIARFDELLALEGP